ncbi:GreA/GreB family elongation factor [Amycolatopsis sp.]|uniref:GreA/GreB family elongation factor n=1 Tax=Amycolatopsis sp. TaxID=37632 RepID=UPI002CB5D2DB|nr:GreA/GreB family elongation factor [Amycolatopsis sp.]HVV12437.1 GreA/GreB family elongation factor [Amycolatopsis sp.]
MTSPESRARLEEELADLRRRRAELAARVVPDPDVGDRGDAGLTLEFDDEATDGLNLVDARIEAITTLLAGGSEAGDGTVAKLRFEDGTEQTVRTVAIAEETVPGQEDGTVTTDSPLGKALAGRQAGDTITYSTPGGEVRAEIVDIRRSS